MLLNTKKEQERWTEHFHKELIRHSPDETAFIPEATEDLDIDTDPQPINITCTQDPYERKVTWL